jgi:hypothetical protein
MILRPTWSTTFEGQTVIFSPGWDCPPISVNEDDERQGSGQNGQGSGEGGGQQGQGDGQGQGGGSQGQGEGQGQGSQPPSISLVFRIIFDLDGGVHLGGGELEQIVPWGGAAVAPVTGRSGYDFKGWSETFDYVTDSYTVKALWEKRPAALPEVLIAIELNAESYARREGMIVAVYNIPRSLEEAGAFVGLYAVGADGADYLDRFHPRLGTDNYEIEAPAEGGQYEARLYSKEGVYDDQTLLATVEFRVN